MSGGITVRLKECRNVVSFDQSPLIVDMAFILNNIYKDIIMIMHVKFSMSNTVADLSTMYLGQAYVKILRVGGGVGQMRR